MADVADDGHVVADEEVCDLEIVLQVLQEVDDLGLDADIECACWLVADDEGGLEGECSCDGDALALATREFVRESVHGVGGHAAPIEEVGDCFSSLLPCACAVVDFEGLGDGLLDAHARVEACGGVLEDHLHVGAGGSELFSGSGGEVCALEDDPACGGLDEAEDGPAQGGFSGA